MNEPPRIADFRQHLEVETPEHVVVDYEIAGLGSRALAVLLDTLIIIGLVVALGIAASLLRRLLPVTSSLVFIVGSFVILWGYFAFFEGFRHGQTPGKRWIGIRVIRETGHPVTFRDAAARNLLRFIDFLPPPYLLGALFVAFHPRARRLGDLVAGTVVVRDRPVEKAFAAPPRTAEDRGVLAVALPAFSDDEFRVLREFSDRAWTLPPEARAALASRLAPRFAARVPMSAPSEAAFLAELFEAESARRSGRLGAVGALAPERRVGSSAIADRLVAEKRDRWLAFQALAERASRDGLDAFAADELPAFARRYREVAADLARARTYRAHPDVLLQLERLVALGHNVLYRDERKTWSMVWRFLSRECPSAIVRARVYVVVAFLTFTLPALGGYVMLRERPGLAEQVLPVGILERVDEGARLRERGVGYAQIAASSRPLAAAAIFTNNVRVAFVCFASGVLFGIGSLVAVAYNGAAIGAVSALYANHGLLGYLWTFVAGHGVLELFSIFLAGAAGLMLGRAIIAPGDLPRGQALVQQGRIAMGLVGASVTLLLVAGSVEGLVSASPAPLAVKLGISIASALFLVAYLAYGASIVRREDAARSGSAGVAT